MFDTKILPSTPGLARRLIQFSQINNMTFDDKLVELAMQDVLSQEELVSAGYSLTSNEVSTLQYIKDWKGRAMVLTPDYEVGRRLAMVHLATSDGRSLILVDVKYYVDWARIVQEYLPTKKICIFGNPRYKDKNWPVDLEFTEKPDLDSDIFITSYGGLIWNNLLNNIQINQSIVEELDHASSVNYNWRNSLEAIFHEIPSPLFLQNIHNLPRDASHDLHTAFQIADSNAINFIMDIIKNYMWAGMGGGLLNHITNRGPSLQHPNAYLKARGYRGDISGFLNLFGVSTDLIDQYDKNKPYVFKDTTISNLAANRRNRQNSNMHNFYLREGELEGKAGQTIQELVRNAIGGDKPSQSVLGALQNNQWANLKASFIKTVCSQLSQGTRTLYVTDNPNMIRSLALHFGKLVAEYSSEPTSKTSTNLIIKPLDLLNNPPLLSSAHYVVVTDLVQSLDDYQKLCLFVETAGAKLVLPYIGSTFEEHCFQLLVQKST